MRSNARRALNALAQVRANLCRGIHSKQPSTSALSTDAAAVLQCLDSPQAAELLAARAIGLNHRVYNEVVFSLCDSDKALAFFHWIASEQSKFKHTAFTIRLMTEALGRMNRHEESRKLSQLWKEQTFPALIVEYSQQGNAVATMELLREMADTGSPSLQLLHACLQGLCRAGNIDGALELLREARRMASLEGSVFAYSILVAALTAAGKNDGVYEILREVRRNKGKVDLVLCVSRMLGYLREGELDKALESFHKLSEEERFEVGGAECSACLVRGLYQSGRTDEACRLAVSVGCESEDVDLLVDKLLELGQLDRARDLIEVVLTHGSSSVKVSTWNNLLAAVCKDPKNIDEAFELLKKMDSLGLEADGATYCIIVQTLCESKTLGNARVLLDHLADRGCAPDARIYDRLVEKLCKTGRICEALEIAREAKARRGTTIVTYNSLLLGFLKARRLNRALKVFEKMTATGPAPDIYTYNILFEGLSRLDRWKMAYKLLPKMNHEGLLPDVVTYNSLIDGLVEKNRYHRAGLLLREMPDRGCQPNAITLTIFLKWLTRKARVDECLQVFQTLLDRELSPNVYTFNTVISALCKAGRLDQAHRLFGTMLTSGCSPNVITYRVLIHGLCLRQELEKALVLLEKMAERGCSPDVTCYNSVVAAYCRQGRIDEAFAMVEQMPCEGNKVTLRALVRGLCKLQLRSFSEQISCDWM